MRKIRNNNDGRKRQDEAMMQPALFAVTHTGGPTRATPMSPWLLRQLDADGHIDLATGATRRARPAQCRTCGATVIRGLDADWCALAADADPDALTAEGEALAKLAHITTYELYLAGEKWHLDRRDRASIAGRPAGHIPGADILAAHRCDLQVALPHGPSNITPPTTAADLPDEPPF